MKTKTSVLVLLMAVFGAGLTHAQVKKPRTKEDYKISTLKEIVAIAVPGDPETGLIENGELSPFRVRVAHRSSTRPISAGSKAALHRWAQCCAGNPDHYTSFYLTEVQFYENATAYWLAVQDRLLADLRKDLKDGETVDLFLIRISTRKGAVLLVEQIHKAVPGNDPLTESQDWIRNNLSTYSGNKFKVDSSNPCLLGIVDSSENAGVSKAVVSLPLNHLDPAKIRVEPQPGGDGWRLWLHTIQGRKTIRFLLYQGSPAESGETDKYSLTFPDREKAEALAEAFRRVINLCAGMKITIQ